MTKITIEFENTAEGVAEAFDVISRFGEPYGLGNDGPNTGTEAPKPKRGRPKTKVEIVGGELVPPVKEQFVNPEPVAVQGSAPTFDPLVALGIPAAQLPPAATSQPAAPAVTPAAPVTVAALTQQHLIQAFTALAKAPGKGPDAMRAVLTGLGVATVGAIPQDKWATAIDAIRKAIG